MALGVYDELTQQRVNYQITMLQERKLELQREIEDIDKTIVSINSRFKETNENI